MSEYSKELQIAVDAALKAGKAIDQYYHQDYSVETKGPDQPVTIADREANEIIHQIIHTHFLGDGWLSEETSDNAVRLKKERVWIIDPLDGTKEFIAKIPEFAVSIALVDKGEPVVGVIYNPATKELFSGSKGNDAWLNQKEKIHVSQKDDLRSATILASRSETKRGEWKKHEGNFVIQPHGGLACKIMEVACGKADGSFSLTPKTEWDFAAAVCLLKEAGGLATLPDGSPLLFNKSDPKVPGILFGNKMIHNELLKYLTSTSSL